MTEQQLCLLLHKGDKKAFDILYNRYWRRLFMFAYKIFEDQLICEDIVQEVFIRLWERSREVKIEELENYLFKATKFQVLNAIRNMKKTMPYDDILPHLYFEPSVELIFEERETRELISKRVRTLPTKCQEIFLLSREEELSNKEIAQRLSVSVRTVESQIYKALRILKKDFGKIGGWIIFFIDN
jgi:RNA polymerase sigma-70 factor (family 1)